MENPNTEAKYNHGDYILSHNDDGYSIGIITDVIRALRASGGYAIDYFVRGCYIDKSQYNAYKIKTYVPIKKICVREEDVLCLVPKEAIESLYDVTMQEGKLL